MNGRKNIWVWNTSLRYLLSHRKEKSRSSSVLSVLGIALGVMALITVLSVMNGFQQNYIENINNVLSYHIRIDNQGESLDPATLEELKELPWVLSITPFSDTQTVITGTVSDPGGGLIRAIPPEALLEDQSLRDHLNPRSGNIELGENKGIILGHELARSLGLFPGDSLNLLTMKGGQFSRLSPSQEEFHLLGTFRTGYAEYDRTLGFISLQDGREYLEAQRVDYGIKIPRRFQDRRYRSQLQSFPGLEQSRITTWRDYNKAFFNALLMEKIMMTLMVSLIFVVVALNIFHSLKRSVAERIEEIALFKAMGANPFQVRTLFVLQGGILSSVGSILGLLTGILLSWNINPVFRAVEWVVNHVNSFFRWIRGQGPDGGFAIYSSQDFYLTEVPVDIMPGDLLIIILAALGFSLLGALLATRRVAAIRPAEVFSYE